MPKVSVITTLYNYRNYIEECIKSFIEQDFDDCEMIIVDDASTDNPYEVIEKYVSDKLTYIRLDKNQGYSHAKNVGIINAKSDILVMLDSDDMLTENSLSMRHEKISKGYDFVHGPVMDLRSKGRIPSKLWKQWIKSKKDASCYRLVHAQSVMLRKSIHRKIGLYDENLRCKSDRELWARVFNHGFKIGWVDDYVSIYRIHSKQMHKSKEKAKHNDRLQREVLALIKKRASNLSDVIMLGE
jgi:glycosyltransferase involved in cell wall biosynthesis